MKNVFFYDTNIGNIAIADNNSAITNICFAQEMDASGFRLWETELINKASKEIIEYLSGERKEFDFPILMEGTDFQKSVWEELRRIPYGSTSNYKEIAKKINKPNSFRAVGRAVSMNPLLFIIPCHRVILSDGSIGKYIGGTDIKKELLYMEGMVF
ncbi:MAG: methylated-DNA--[protein]-cysteine S-methyltransferase [Andreesenia angusta]|nr:methylated-DNA--[protein]-cysteine S-methyltransferase [Andreesenia angusta]